MTDPAEFVAEFYHEADLRLAQAVPERALAVLDADCRRGHLGEVLKHVQPARTIVGLCADAREAGEAGGRLDRVLACDITTDLPDLAPASFDCVVIGDKLAGLREPLAALATLRTLLKPDGRLIAVVANGQHWRHLDALLCGDLQASNAGGVPPARSMGFANAIKLLLDAGFLPHIKDRRTQPPPPGWLDAAGPLAARLRLDGPTFAARTAAREFFIEATPIAGLPPDTAPYPPVTVGVCTNDADILADNLLASPCLAGDAHQVLRVEGATNAAEGLNAVIDSADHGLVVLAHQDVYLPRWWIARLWQQYEAARAAFGGEIGILGVYGVLGSEHGITRFGRVADREFLLDEGAPLPARVGSLDELLLVVPRHSPVRFDPVLGFHLYATDACLTAGQHGLPAVVIDAPCFHNSKQGSALPDAYRRSGNAIAAKWPDRLPLATPCGVVSLGGVS
ncbi:methyltransferase domain-containing protein [Azospira restricta]|uniref:Methyltransferase domain-containing protein n=1 Tax=Azospira restricta TaxID=404405 RepID=A0A974Y5P2_9RHOO|nr:methyltransferase domain-containing protein [Azospira restricta]QRJ65496.1 methyltransferase domain-containing protein [Azospira restricta]